MWELIANLNRNSTSITKGAVCHCSFSLHRTEMRIAFVLLVVSALVGCSARAQRASGVRVVDAGSGQPVPFATCTGERNRQGGYADQNGYLDLSTLDQEDTVLISCVGYRPVRLAIAQLHSRKSVMLEPHVVALDEITVHVAGKSRETAYMPNHEHSAFGASMKGLELATCVPFPSGDHVRKITRVSMKAQKPNDNNPCRLHLYEPDAQGSPGREILQYNILLSSGHFKGKEMTFDLSAYKVYTRASGVFVGIEWLGTGTSKKAGTPRFFMTHSSPEARTYTRTLAYRDWVPFDKPFTSTTTHPPNLLISLTYEE